MSQGITICLTAQEMAMAAIVGAARHAESVQQRRRDAHGLSSKKDGLGLHIAGACGEMAVAKWRGVYWGGHVNTFKGADLGRNVQVRTRSDHKWDLIVRSDDADNDAFVLVTGTAPLLVLRGWMWGREAKQDRYLDTHGGREQAWFVPQADLRPMLRAEQQRLSA